MECKNCSFSVQTHQNYCSNCGAKVIKNKLTAKNLSIDFSEQFLSYDNAFLKTLIALIKYPEDVINGYINGTRKKYIGVIQFFAISLTFAGVQIFLMNTFFKDAIDYNLLIGNPTKEITNNPQSFQLYQNAMTSYYNVMQNYQNLIYIISVPIGAFATWIVFKFTGFKKNNFIEHVVINTYYSAQIIIVLSIIQILFLVLGLNFVIISSVVTIITVVYYFYIFKRIFPMSFLNNLARMLLVMLIYLIAFIVFMMIMITIIVLRQKSGV